MDEDVQKLLRDNPAVWRAGDSINHGVGGIATGFTLLDAVLPGGGWPANALVEIITPQWGIGELQLLMPVMLKFNREQRWLVWIAPPYIPYPPALQELGIDISRIMVLQPEQGSTGKKNNASNDVIWSMEKALRAEQCGMILAWPQRITTTAIRRLQLAAESGHTLGILFRQFVAKTSPAALRIQLMAVGDDLQLHILKARGGCRTRCIHINLSSRPL